MAGSISRQLCAWADSLQNSPITGQRHLTEKTRQTAEQRNRADAFLQKLKEAQNKPIRAT